MGGVKLGFTTPEEAAKIVTELNAKFSKQAIDYHGVMLYKMVPTGLEMMIGANRDATFGPITVSGLGGVMVEILKDVVFNMCPASVEEATASLDRLKTQKMLKGFRGQPALNKQKFGEYIATISEIMSQCDIIKEIDINPLIQLHDGSLTAVDSVFTLKHCSVCSVSSFYGYCGRFILGLYSGLCFVIGDNPRTGRILHTSMSVVLSNSIHALVLLLRNAFL